MTSYLKSLTQILCRLLKRLARCICQFEGCGALDTHEWHNRAEIDRLVQSHGRSQEN